MTGGLRGAATSAAARRGRPAAQRPRSRPAAAGNPSGGERAAASGARGHEHHQIPHTHQRAHCGGSTRPLLVAGGVRVARSGDHSRGPPMGRSLALLELAPAGKGSPHARPNQRAEVRGHRRAVGRRDLGGARRPAPGPGQRAPRARRLRRSRRALRGARPSARRVALPGTHEGSGGGGHLAARTCRLPTSASPSAGSDEAARGRFPRSRCSARSP